MTMQLYLIRHGMTQGNTEGRYVGRTDEPLCAAGERKLRAQLRYMPDIGSGFLYVSGMKRCRESGRILFPQARQKVIPDFHECDFGEFEGHTAEELAPYKEFSEWLAGKEDAKPLNGESNADFSKRVCDTFNKTVEGLFKTGIQNAAIITHGGVITVLLSAFGLPELPMTEWLCPSGCGYTVRITPSLWEKTGKFEVVCDIPAEPLTNTQEERLWDYYREIGDDDDYDYERDIREDFDFNE